MVNKIYKINIILIILIIILIIININNYLNQSNILKDKINNEKQSNVGGENTNESKSDITINKNKQNILENKTNINIDVDKDKNDINIDTTKKEIFDVDVKFLSISNNYIKVLIGNKNKKIYFDKNTMYYKYNILSDTEYNHYIKKIEKEMNDLNLKNESEEHESPAILPQEYIQTLENIKDLKLSKNDDLQISYKKKGNIYLLLDIIKK